MWFKTDETGIILQPMMVENIKLQMQLELEIHEKTLDKHQLFELPEQRQE